MARQQEVEAADPPGGQGSVLLVPGLLRTKDASAAV